MRIPVLLLAPALLGGCAATPGANQDRPQIQPPREGGGACVADGASRFVGQRVTEALSSQIIAATGAKTLRWGPPGGAMTMDFREDRVNVFYDANMVIERITCG